MWEFWAQNHTNPDHGSYTAKKTPDKKRALPTLGSDDETKKLSLIPQFSFPVSGVPSAVRLGI